MLYFDPYYFLIVVPALLLGLWAQMNVKSTYGKYSRVHSRRGLTGSQAARQILDNAGLTNVRVEQVAGQLSDHYDPRTNVVRLSDGVYSSNSLAALGVAAHECGHAIQHGNGYAPLKIRNAIIPVTNFGSAMAVPLILVGLLFSFYPLILIGLIGYSLIALFQLITLPVEFNASNRAMSILSGSYMLEGEELKGARKVLTAAALTYVAALISSLAQLLRLFLLYGRKNSRRR